MKIPNRFTMKFNFESKHFVHVHKIEMIYVHIRSLFHSHIKSIFTAQVDNIEITYIYLLNYILTPTGIKVL